MDRKPEDSPFAPGARVAIEVQRGWRRVPSYKEGFVEKVHKSGNFTLKGSPQQWRPFPPSGWQKYWHASATGSSTGSLRIWDEASDSDIVDRIHRAQLCNRFEAAHALIEQATFSDATTEEQIRQLEAAAAPFKPKRVAA